MFKIAIIAIMSVCMGLFFQGIKNEYSVVIAVVASTLIFSIVVSQIKEVILLMEKIRMYMQMDLVYLKLLLKMMGVTYISEFTSGICKDAGFSNIANQVEIAGKLVILTISIPVITSLLEIVTQYISA